MNYYNVAVDAKKEDVDEEDEEEEVNANDDYANDDSNGDGSGAVNEESSVQPLSSSMPATGLKCLHILTHLVPADLAC